MTIRKSFLATSVYRILEKSILPITQKLIKNPNHFTILGLVLALVVPLCFYIHPFVGFLLMTFSGLADMMDGLLAKTQKAITVWGAFLDSSIDRISDFFYLMGFWILFLKSDQVVLASIFIWLSILFTFMISYVKARAEGLGVRCEKGLMERGLRMIYLIAWALLLSIFPAAFGIILWSGLITFCILSLTTFIQRMKYIRDTMALLAT